MRTSEKVFLILFITLLAGSGTVAEGSEFVVFSALWEGNREIYRSGLDGTGIARLTFDPGHDREPRLSPNGQKIVFVSNRTGQNELYLMNVDGSNVTRITFSGVGGGQHDGSAAWSPDGLRLVYGHVDSLFTMNSDGTNRQHVVTAPPGRGIRYPDWSPAGNKLGFIAESPTWGYNADCYMLDPDGSNLQVLVADRPGREYGAMRFSPDGLRVAYTYDPSQHEEGSGRMLDSRIFVIDINTLAVDSVSINKPPNTNDILADWSLDGNQLLITNFPSSSQPVQGDVWVMDADGDNRELVLSDAMGHDMGVTGTEVCGDVSGTWTTIGSPYWVACNIAVAPGDSLIIEAGVEVWFLGPYALEIGGYLNAVGSTSDTILFSCDILQNPSRWRGIRFTSDADDASRLEYCQVEYGQAGGGSEADFGGGLYFMACSPTVSHCLIQNNRSASGFHVRGGGINCTNASPTITHCEISYNWADWYGGGIAIFNNSAPVIADCWIHGNQVTDTYSDGGGILISESSPIISHCTIEGNSANRYTGGLHCVGSNALVQDCIIRLNTSGSKSAGLLSRFQDSSRFENLIITHNDGPAGAVYIWENSIPAILNCLVAFNEADTASGGILIRDASPIVRNTIIAFNAHNGLWFESGGAGATVEHCDVYGNSHGTVGFGMNDPSRGPNAIFIPTTTNANGDVCDPYNNIWLDPALIDTLAPDYHLADRSHCIGAGTLVDYPAQDMEGTTRPQPLGSYPDLGPYEHHQDQPSAARDAFPATPAAIALSVFPNPFNAIATIAFNHPVTGHIILRVFDLHGREIVILKDNTLEAGTHNVQFDASKLASGLYFVRLEAGPISLTKKLMLLK